MITHDDRQIEVEERTDGQRHNVTQRSRVVRNPILDSRRRREPTSCSLCWEASTRVIRGSSDVRLQQRNTHAVRTHSLIHTTSGYARTLLQTLASAASDCTKRTLRKRHRIALRRGSNTTAVCTTNGRERGTHGKRDTDICKQTVSVPTGERSLARLGLRIAETVRTVMERVGTCSVEAVIYRVNSTPFRYTSPGPHTPVASRTRLETSCNCHPHSGRDATRDIP